MAAGPYTDSRKLLIETYRCVNLEREKEREGERASSSEMSFEAHQECLQLGRCNSLLRVKPFDRSCLLPISSQPSDGCRLDVLLCVGQL